MNGQQIARVVKATPDWFTAIGDEDDTTYDFFYGQVTLPDYWEISGSRLFVGDEVIITIEGERCSLRIPVYEDLLRLSGILLDACGRDLTLSQKIRLYRDYKISQESYIKAARRYLSRDTAKASKQLGRSVKKVLGLTRSVQRTLDWLTDLPSTPAAINSAKDLIKGFRNNPSEDFGQRYQLIALKKVLERIQSMRGVIIPEKSSEELSELIKQLTEITAGW